MQLKLLKFDRPAGVGNAAQHGGITWALDRLPNAATDLGGARLFLAVNRGFSAPTATFNVLDNRYILIYDSLGTTLKQVHTLPPRNSIAMMKAPTDRIAICNVPICDSNDRPFSDNPSIGGEHSEVAMTSVTPLGFSDHPIIYQNPGDWKFSFRNGINPSTNSDQHDGACDTISGSSLGGATLVHAANIANHKACIQIQDANGVIVGNIQLPRGAHIKLRKRPTDVVYASEKIDGTGGWHQCKVIFNKIGYTN